MKKKSEEKKEAALPKKTVTAPFIDGFDGLDTRPASCPIQNCEDLSCVGCSWNKK